MNENKILLYIKPFFPDLRTRRFHLFLFYIFFNEADCIFCYYIAVLRLFCKLIYTFKLSPYLYLIPCCIFILIRLYILRFLRQLVKLLRSSPTHHCSFPKKMGNLSDVTMYRNFCTPRIGRNLYIHI